ncbi:MAG: family peptidase [Humibacillus sp.]|nr:family peptidase [Humibacillus sp.]
MSRSHLPRGFGLAAALGAALTFTAAVPPAGTAAAALPAADSVTADAPAADLLPAATTADPIRATSRAVTMADVRYTWRSGCPVPPSKLRVVEMNFRGYDGVVKRGMLIVRYDKVAQTAAIFRAAYVAGFKIRRMDNPNKWYGSDEEMMKADNTSAFNCRRVTGNSTRLSPHSYGTAIDVNTMRNPYKAANGLWYPPNGLRWTNRSLRDAGMIFSWSTITKQVVSRGGVWGGYWTYKDYQHFELG